MITLNNVINFLEIYPALTYEFFFLGSFFETLIGPGFFIYGEVIFLAGAILAGTGALNIWLVSIACISGGIAGDNLSFIIGRKYGEKAILKFVNEKNKVFNEKNYSKGKTFFNRYGAKSLFLARFFGPLSWITPFIAGISEIQYRKFFLYNSLGVIFGIGQFLVIGYFFGFSYILFLKKIEKYVLIIVILIVIFFILYIFKEKEIFKTYLSKVKIHQTKLNKIQK